MGVWHFMSLGESPGAVTAALSYIKKRYEQNDIDFFGSDSGRAKAKKVSGIVIFTTPEVRHGQLSAKGKTCIDNPYNSDKGKEISLSDGKGKLNTFEIVLHFIRKEFRQMLEKERGKVYWLKADYRDLEFNLRQVARAFYVLSPPGTTGREIWVNLTGGSNVMNIATLLITVMSGVTGRAYYTYTRDTRLLQPANEDEFWCDIPVLKVDFDRNYEAILRILKKQKGWIEAKNLLSQVKRYRLQLSDLTEEDFRRNYLNKLDGWLIEREGNRNRLSQAGHRFLKLIDEEIIKALVYKEPLETPLLLNDVFDEEVPLAHS